MTTTSKISHLSEAKTYEQARAFCVEAGSILTPEGAAEILAAGGLSHSSADGRLVSLDGRVWAVAKNAVERRAA